MARGHLILSIRDQIIIDPHHLTEGLAAAQINNLTPTDTEQCAVITVLAPVAADELTYQSL